MRQELAERLLQAGNSTKSLKTIIEEIDAEKRSIRSSLSQLSSEPDHQFAKGKERQTLIRRMKDKISFLTEEREVVRARLGRIKMDRKALNRAESQRSVEFSRAFIAAAERILPVEQFNEIEARAAEIAQIES